jgi:hypothetical protein
VATQRARVREQASSTFSNGKSGWGPFVLLLVGLSSAPPPQQREMVMTTLLLMRTSWTRQTRRTGIPTTPPSLSLMSIISAILVRSARAVMMSGNARARRHVVLGRVHSAPMSAKHSALPRPLRAVHAHGARSNVCIPQGVLSGAKGAAPLNLNPLRPV